MWPVDISKVTQEFGQYPNPEYQPDGHTGMDFGVPLGTPVKAVADGVVLFADWSQNLGWPNPYYVAIDFDGPANGDQSAGIVVIIDHGPYVSVSAHLNQTGLNPGNRVTEGQVIGQVGNTGRSTGSHLHFEILPDGWNVYGKWYGRIDPRSVIKTEKVGALMALSDAEQSELLSKVRELHRDLSQGIPGVRSDGDSFKFLRDIGAKIGVAVDETARKAKYGKK